MGETHYPNPIWQAIMALIKKRDIDPAVLAKIKDEAAWEKAKKRFVAEGKEEGILAGKRELAKNLLDVLDSETIALKSGLSIEVVQRLKKGMSD